MVCFIEQESISKPRIQPLRKHGIRKNWKRIKDVTRNTGKGKYMIKKLPFFPLITPSGDYKVYTWWENSRKSIELIQLATKLHIQKNTLAIYFNQEKRTAEEEKFFLIKNWENYGTNNVVRYILMWQIIYRCKKGLDPG